MEFETRYKNLNDAQKQAVDHIDGPLMVIAGPGTGKTELLSMRVANILRKTDTSPRNILCLTFTDSGAEAMRTRLAAIIGPSAYEVAINTFHSFGSDIMASNREYFYRGAQFRPADTIASLEILTRIFDELDHTNPLSSKMNDEYTYLSDAVRTISQLKRSGLTSDELLKILDAGDVVIDEIEPQLQEIFTSRVSLKMLPALSNLAQTIASLPPEPMPRGLTPLSHTFALSLAHAVDEAESSDSTKPITTFKSLWLKKNEKGKLVLKSRERHQRLRQMSFVYYRYLAELEKAGLYDFDDMILEVIHAIETHPDLKANLQEQYQYILVDEFQDTNLAQARLLLNLVDNPVNEGAPNLMTVGDDDQAIYSFQGAEIGNVMQFRREFPSQKLVTLTQNYRSAPAILTLARQVITQGEDRLENFDDTLDKTLQPNAPAEGSKIALFETTTTETEYADAAERIAALIKQGAAPESIAVLARRHSELEPFAKHLAAKGILANYERQNNLLELEIIRTLELTAELIREIQLGHIDHADELLPEFLTLPALAIDPKIIWQLSLKAWRDKQSWLELMAATPELNAAHAWLIDLSTFVAHTPTEPMIDMIFGIMEGAEQSPLFAYFFGSTLRKENPQKLLENITALTQLRAPLHDYLLSLDEMSVTTISDLLEFINLYRSYKQTITFRLPVAGQNACAVHLMTAHKAKGLEFDHVFVLGLDDTAWGARARKAPSKISYPENLPLAPNTGSRDEQLRLLYVALTRAKKTLNLSFSNLTASGKERALSDLLLVDDIPKTQTTEPKTLDQLIDQQLYDWRTGLADVPAADLATLLAPTLDRYKLSATHVNNFVDVTRGGPQYFLLQNMLHLPQSLSPNAAFGTAIHAALQSAQTHLLATGSSKPLEDVIHDFETNLGRASLDEKSLKFYSQKGADVLHKFLASDYTGFTKNAQAEFDFAHQNVVINGAKLTGKIDLLTRDKDEKTIEVIDYKTAKPLHSWRGKSDYEKIKLHKYRQQLMFYRLLAENSRDFSADTWISGAIQFVEPDKEGEIVPPLQAEFSDEDYARFRQLVAAIWQSIMALDFIDTSGYSEDYAGILAFEEDLIDKYTKK